MDKLNKIITYHYKFIFEDGEKKEFVVKLDKKKLDLIKAEEVVPPDWAKLQYFKCPICPLDEERHPFCPVAVNLVDVVEFFRSSISYNEVDMLIETDERSYIKHTSLQQGISSLVGIYMVTSGCPIMDKFKPMVRFHLPFATIKETKYRAVSMYLLAQYFLYKQGNEPDWELKRLVKI